LEDLREQTKEIRVVKPFTEELDAETSSSLIDEHFKMEVIDFENVFGVSLDRDTNNRTVYNRVRKHRKNMRMYVPAEL